MSNRSGRPDIGRIVLGLILLSVGLSALGLEGGMIGALFVLAGIAFLAAMASGRISFESSGSSRREARQRERRLTEARRREAIRRSREDPFAPRQPQRDTPPQRSQQQAPQRSPARDRMHRAAAQAMARAGQDPRQSPVRLTDVGLLVYDGSDAPYVERENRLPDDADHVRPFMVLRAPQAAQGRIRFELLDGQGTRRFVDESQWRLQAGETFIYPETWLPLRNLDTLAGNWTLRVYAAGLLIGAHEFHWRDAGGGRFREYIDGDGEFTDELAQDIKKVRLHRLSLEDLLADQDGGLVEVDPEVEAAARRHDQLNRQHNRRR